MAEEQNGDKYSSEEMKKYFSDPTYRKKNQRRRRSFRLSRKSTVILAIAIVFLSASWIYVDYLLSGLPSLERIENPKPELATTVFSSDGEVLDRFYIKNRSQTFPARWSTPCSPQKTRISTVTGESILSAS
jgi:penicillin-binding protein 1A